MASAAIKTCHNVIKIAKNCRFSGRIVRTTFLRRYATEVIMPSLSPTMQEGTIVKWYKKEGDTISPGDVLCDIQTDKAVVGYDVEDEGILAKIIKPDDSKDVKIGTLIAMIADEGEDWKNIEIPASASVTSDQPPGAPPETTKHSDHITTMGPSVRRLMEEYSISVSDITPTGPHDMVIKSDILNHIKKLNLSKAPIQTPTDTVPKPVTPVSADITTPQPIRQPSTIIPTDGPEYVDIPHTNMRRVIAQRLTQSKQTIPHSYASITSDVSAAVKLRKELAGNGVKISMNDFIIKSAGVALQRVPRVNSIYEGQSHQRISSVDISVAVATDKGLITPIVRNVAELGVDEISRSVRSLASKARDGKLKPEEYQGGSFSVSNLGMFGISEFSAVINPPQTAILAIGTSQLALNSSGAPCTQMTVTLSYDSRVIDEVEASKFLEVFRDTMENPSTMTAGLNRKQEKEAYAF